MHGGWCKRFGIWVPQEKFEEEPDKQGKQWLQCDQNGCPAPSTMHELLYIHLKIHCTYCARKKAFAWDFPALCISWLKGEPTVPAQAPMNKHRGTSQVAEWIRICLPMHGKWVQSLVQEQEWNKLYLLRALKALGSGKIGMRGRVYVEIAVNIGRKVICCVCSSYCLWRGICLMM